MIAIKTVVDSKRGCGWRKPGGIYLRTEPRPMAPCGRLPLPLTVCPCCGGGIKPTMGWTWVSPKLLFKGTVCLGASPRCALCPLREPPERAGLLWIGREFYKTPEEFTSEAAKLGISRRIHSVPRGFKLGEDWVMIAHRQAWPGKEPGEFVPAVFQMFKPTAIEYITRGNETEEELEALAARGITPVKVQRDGYLPGLDDEVEEGDGEGEDEQDEPKTIRNVPGLTTGQATWLQRRLKAHWQTTKSELVTYAKTKGIPAKAARVFWNRYHKLADRDTAENAVTE